jgi:hypothetical protein
MKSADSEFCKGTNMSLTESNNNNNNNNNRDNAVPEHKNHAMIASLWNQVTTMTPP